jgi:hypothetical protein
MEQPVIINAERVKAIREKLTDPVKAEEALADLKKIIEVKQMLLWRADAGTCCGSLGNITTALIHEVTILENALDSAVNGRKTDAVLALKEYEQLLESNDG